MNCTRDWRNHIPALGVKLEGGLLKDDTGNHFFMTIQRRGTGNSIEGTCLDYFVSTIP